MCPGRRPEGRVVRRQGGAYDGAVAQGWARYEARGEISRSQTGRLFLAFDKSASRQVTVKELSPTLIGVPGFLDGFRAEVQVMTRLESANCVRVFEFFEQDGRPFLVQEYVEGRSLRELVGSLRPEQALGILKGILSGLGYAHALGLVHKDLTPENVLFDSAGVPKVTNFGQPLPVEGPGAAGGTALGTPAYISPEQVRGEAVDARSDLYSTGIVMFELLTGRLPYQASDPAELMRMHLDAPVPDPREIVPEMPDDVAFVIGKAMTKDPATRPPSALAFYNELVASAGGGYGADWESRSSITSLLPAATASPAVPMPTPTAAAPVTGVAPSPRIRPLRALAGLVLGAVLLLGGLGYGGSQRVLPGSLASLSFGVFSGPPFVSIGGGDSPGSPRPFSGQRNHLHLGIAVGAVVAGIAMLLMTVRGLARRIRGRRLGQRLPGRFLVPAVLYLGVVGGLAVLLLAAATNYLWDIGLIPPPPI